MSATERAFIIAALLGAAFIIGRYTERQINDVDGLYGMRSFRRATMSAQAEKKIVDRWLGDYVESRDMKGLGKWSRKHTR